MHIQFKQLAIAAGVLLAISTSAFSADAMLGTGGYARQLQKMEMMKMLDADGNHMVTLAESDSYYNSVFDSLDKNGDGSLDAKEWTGATKDKKIELATGGYSRELRNIKMMDTMDADHDHQVTRDEFLNFHRAVFAKRDTSNDQQLDAQEWAAKTLSAS